MASADCECCGQPTTAPEPYLTEPDGCECECFDCDECEECWHGGEPEYVIPVVLCDGCQEDPCGPGAWHCICGRACDGSACPGEPLGPHFRNGSVHDVRSPDDGGTS